MNYGIEGIGPTSLQRIYSYLYKKCRNGYANRCLYGNSLSDDIGMRSNLSRIFYVRVQKKVEKGNVTYENARSFTEKLLKEHNIYNSGIRTITIGSRMGFTGTDVQGILHKHPSIKKKILGLHGRKIDVSSRNYKSVLKKLLATPEYKNRLAENKASRQGFPDNVINTSSCVPTPAETSFVHNFRYLDSNEDDTLRLLKCVHGPSKIASMRALKELLGGKPRNTRVWLKTFGRVLYAAHERVGIKLGQTVIDTSYVAKFFSHKKMDIKKWYFSNKKNYPVLKETAEMITNLIDTEFGSVLKEDGKKSNASSWGEIDFSPRREHRPLDNLPD